MPKFKSNAYLTHNGALVKIGEEVELTAEQAKHLGDKVTAIQEEIKNSSLYDNTVAELKTLAEGMEIDGFGNMKKDELIQAIEEKQKVEA